MKLNIKRLQEGGGMPFVVYQPTPSLTTPDTSSAETTSSKSSKKNDDDSDKPNLLSKEVINELIKKGLPNDVNQFLKDLQIAEKGSLMGLDKGISGIDRNQLYSLASKANQLIHNSNLMGSATKQAYDNDGLEELAVSTTGLLFVQDKSGKIAKLSMAEYNKKRDSVYAMTVNDLSKARMYNPNLAFDTEIISTIQNSMGINKINDYMLGILNKLGTETLNKEGYIDKQELGKKIAELSNGKNPTDAEIQGIRELASTYQTMGKDGIYKITRDSSSQRNHISAGYDYLWSMLPNNAKNVLKARYVVDGNEGSNPVNIIKNSFDLFTNESRKIGMDYPAGMNEKEGNGDGSGNSATSTYSQSPMEKLANGDLDVRDDIILRSDDNADYGFKFKGSLIGALPTLDGKWINEPSTLGKVLQNSVWGIIDRDNMYFGNQKLQMYDLDKIVHDGKFAAKTWVPVDSSGAPNYMLLKNYQNALEKIKRDEVTNPSQMNEIMQQMGAGFIQFDANGNIAPMSRNYLKPFLLIHGSSTTGAKFTENNTMTNKLSGDLNKQNKEYLESIFKKNELEMPDTGLFTSNDVIQAPILIALSPASTNDAQTFTGKGALIDKGSVAQRGLLEPKNLPVSSQYLY